MKTNRWTMLALMPVLTASFSSCEAIGSIFKAGVWVGVLAVVGLIVLVLFIISRAGGKK